MKKLFALTLCSLLMLATNAMAISKYSVGEYEIYMLPENQMTGNVDIFANANPEDVKKFFKEKTFPMYLNTFIIRGPEHITLVDAGFGNRLFEHLQSLKISVDEIDNILLTHMHRDHIGGLLKDGKVAFPHATLWLAKQERDYWGNKDIQKSAPQKQQQGFDSAQAVLKAYADKVKIFEPLPVTEPAQYLLEGIRPVAIFGHTPGHTAFFVGKSEDALLIWGDLVHVASIQLPMPRVALIYDIDKAQAVNTRLELLHYIVRNDITVMGMHMGRKGAFTLKKHGRGYEFEENK